MNSDFYQHYYTFKCSNSILQKKSDQFGPLYPLSETEWFHICCVYMWIKLTAGEYRDTSL